MVTNHSPKRPASDATMWQHQCHDLAERQSEIPFFATTFSRPFKDQSGEWRNGTSFGLNDLGSPHECHL